MPPLLSVLRSCSHGSCETSSRTCARSRRCLCATPCGVACARPRQDTTNFRPWTQRWHDAAVRRSNRTSLPTSERRWPGSRTSARVAATTGRGAGMAVDASNSTGHGRRLGTAARWTCTPMRCRCRCCRAWPTRPGRPRRRPDGIVRLDPRVSGVGPGAPLPLARSQYDVAVRLSEMDGAGVDRHAVSLPPFLFASTADDAQFVAGHRRGRATTSWPSYVAEAPDRLLGLGSVPLGWPGAAEEARRCLDELGLAGIAIGSRGGGKDLDDPVNDELWALLAERGTSSSCTPAACRTGAGEGLLDATAGRVPDGNGDRGGPAGRSAACWSAPDPAVPCPRRGCLPSLRAGWTWVEPQGGRPTTTAVPPSDFIDRLYYDTAVFNPTLLRRLVEDVGAEHVMLGTDHPSNWATSRRGRRWATRVGRDRQPGDPLGQRGPAAPGCRSRPADPAGVTASSQRASCRGRCPGAAPSSASGRGTGSGTAHTISATDRPGRNTDPAGPGNRPHRWQLGRWQADRPGTLWPDPGPDIARTISPSSRRAS